MNLYFCLFDMDICSNWNRLSNRTNKKASRLLYLCHPICSSVVRTNHLSQRASCRGPQEGEAGAPLPWQRHSVWHPVDIEVGEWEGPQAWGRGGGGWSGFCQGASSTVLPHGSLCVRQQQHVGAQLHLCLRQRLVFEARGEGHAFSSIAITDAYINFP